MTHLEIPGRFSDLIILCEEVGRLLSFICLNMNKSNFHKEKFGSKISCMLSNEISKIDTRSLGIQKNVENYEVM